MFMFCFFKPCLLPSTGPLGWAAGLLRYASLRRAESRVTDLLPSLWPHPRQRPPSVEPGSLWVLGTHAQRGAAKGVKGRARSGGQSSGSEKVALFATLNAGPLVTSSTY